MDVETPAASSAESLRTLLVDKLRAQGSIRTGVVEAAMLAVPRHLFLPMSPLEEAYAVKPVVTKRAADGSSLSSASQPDVVATMLEQADVRPGHRILEIGAGTGYNAALLAHLVGETGAVTTIDIFDDVVDDARANLKSAGVDNVRVLCADGEFGDVDDAPYDRIVVTVGTQDIPPGWLRQLAPEGRLVVPLRLRGTTRTIAFDREDDRLASRSVESAGFVPMQGAGAYSPHIVRLTEAGDVTLRIDDAREVDDPGLVAALERPGIEVWTGVTFASGTSYEHLDLWMAGATTYKYARLAAERGAVARGVVRPALRIGSPAGYDGPNLAYLAERPTEDHDDAGRRLFEVGIIGHGADGDRLARLVAARVRTWDDTGRPGPPCIEVHPAGTPDDRLTGFVIDRRHSRVAFTWDRP